MNYYTEDFWQAEMLNPSLYNTVINNIDDEQCVMGGGKKTGWKFHMMGCLLYTSPSPRDTDLSRMPSSA